LVGMSLYAGSLSLVVLCHDTCAHLTCCQRQPLARTFITYQHQTHFCVWDFLQQHAMLANCRQLQMPATAASLPVSMPHKHTLGMLEQVVYRILTSQAWVHHQPHHGVWLCAAMSGVYDCVMPFAGLQSLLSVQSSYQLSQHSTAALALTYQQGAGLGMQVSLCLAICLTFALSLPSLCLVFAFLPLPCFWFIAFLFRGQNKVFGAFLLSHVVRSYFMSTDNFGLCSMQKAFCTLMHIVISSIWPVTVVKI